MVMGRAPYHTVRVDGPNAPTSARRKPDMMQWLQKKNIPMDPVLTKFTKQQKGQESVQNNADSHLQSQGPEVVRLPPCRCEFSPVELSRGDLRQSVAKHNKKFKPKDFRNLIDQGLQLVKQSR